LVISELGRIGMAPALHKVIVLPMPSLFSCEQHGRDSSIMR